MSSAKTMYVVRYTGDLTSLKGAVGHQMDLYWFHGEDRFCYASGPRTLYLTREAAEGGILWIIARKGPDYIGDLEVVEVNDGREFACRG